MREENPFVQAPFLFQNLYFLGVCRSPIKYAPKSPIYTFEVFQKCNGVFETNMIKF